MFIATLIAASTTDTSGIHIVMLVLILVAVALIITGGTIAAFTLYNLRKAQATQTELESEPT